MNNYYIPLFALLLSSGAGGLMAQDLHYSQSYFNPQHQSPALTGIFEGNKRANLHYRSQWETVPVQYRTMAAGFETKIISRDNNMLAAGLLLQRDQAGDAELSWTQIGLNINAAHNISSRQTISAGFGLLFFQRKADYSNLKWNNQWDGDIYNPSLPSKETLNDATGLKPSLSAGINWHFKLNPQSRTAIDAGAAAMHLNKPDVNFRTDMPRALPVRVGVYGQSYIQANLQYDYVIFAHYQQMQKANETLIGAGVRYWLTEESAIQLAGATRIGDAIIPSIAVQRNQWKVGISYDINISAFKIATNRRGGFEIAAVYTAAPVKPPKELKVCPVF